MKGDVPIGGYFGGDGGRGGHGLDGPNGMDGGDSGNGGSALAAPREQHMRYVGIRMHSLSVRMSTPCREAFEAATGNVLAFRGTAGPLYGLGLHRHDPCETNAGTDITDVIDGEDDFAASASDLGQGCGLCRWRQRCQRLDRKCWKCPRCRQWWQRNDSARQRRQRWRGWHRWRRQGG